MIYREDDWIAEVEVLTDTSDDKWQRVELKVIRTIRVSAIYKPTEDGTVLKVCKQKAPSHFSNIWSLDKE